jgi:hypothetical protein
MQWTSATTWLTCVHGVRLKDHCAECPQQTVETPPKTEPFAELATDVHKYAQALARDRGFIPGEENFACCVGAIMAAYKTALPTPEQYVQAARQIADGPDEELTREEYERWVEQILTSTLGQPGGKK